MDRNLALYLAQQLVLTSIDANRPEAWFLGPLGLYAAWFPCICLISDFEQVKASGNPTKSPFRFGVIWGVKIKKNHFLRIQPIYVKCLLSDMCKVLKYNFHRLGILRGKVKGVSNNIFLVRNLPPDFIVLSVDLESAPGADRRVAARQIGQQRAIWVYMQLGFPPSALFASGRSRTNCAI